MNNNWKNNITDIHIIYAFCYVLGQFIIFHNLFEYNKKVKHLND